MVEDLYEEKFLPGVRNNDLLLDQEKIIILFFLKVLKNLYSLGRLLQMRTSWFGPKLEAIRAPAWLATSEGLLIDQSISKHFSSLPHSFFFSRFH